MPAIRPSARPPRSSTAQAASRSTPPGSPPGTYRYFAGVLDSNRTLERLVTADLDRGRRPTTTATTPPRPRWSASRSSTSGTIEIAGDVDWFKFQAVAGKTYVFSAQLGTLPDSILCLYDAGGTTRLAFNDDYGSLASQITWTATASGTYYLAVAGYGITNTGTYSLSVQVQNAPPVLGQIADQTMSGSQTTLSMTLSASDADGDPLTYSAHAMTVDPLAQRAYALDQQLGLHTFPDGTYYTNARGASEKYMVGTNDVLYFILPNGALYRWGGSIAGSMLADTLTPSYYATPALLHDAQPLVYMPISADNATVGISGNTLTINRAANYGSDFYVQVNVSDGLATTTQTFRVAVANTPPALTQIADQTMSGSRTTLALTLNASDPDGDPLTYSARAVTIDPVAQRAYALDQQLGLHTFPGSVYY